MTEWVLYRCLPACLLAYHEILKNSSWDELSSLALLYVPRTHAKDAGARVPKGPKLADRENPPPDLGPIIPWIKGSFIGWKSDSMDKKSLTNFGFMFDNIVVRNSIRFTADPGPKDPLKM